MSAEVQMFVIILHRLHNEDVKIHYSYEKAFLDKFYVLSNKSQQFLASYYQTYTFPLSL